MRAAFFLYHFNDIDHIAPVIWRWLEEGHAAWAVLLDPTYSPDKDPRLRLLSEYERFYLEPIQEALGLPWAARLFPPQGYGSVGRTWHKIRAGLARVGLSSKLARRWLDRVAPRVCIFEWGAGYTRGRSEFFAAATRSGLPRVALPHGLKYYLNQDMTPQMRRILEEGRQIRRNYAVYDAFVYQSEYHRDQDVELGMDPAICRVLGSARFCPEWEKVHTPLYPPFRAARDPGERTRIVMMVPHWEYNVDKQQTLALIQSLAQEQGIYFVVKEHPREALDLPDSVEAKLAATPAFERTRTANSVSLIRWADAVVNFGSSIGIEVIHQGKAMVYPSFLHENRTIYEITGACVETRDIEETRAVLTDSSRLSARQPTEEQIRALDALVVYGGRDPFDVLGAYTEMLRELATEAGEDRI